MLILRQSNDANIDLSYSGATIDNNWGQFKTVIKVKKWELQHQRLMNENTLDDVFHMIKKNAHCHQHYMPRTLITVLHYYYIYYVILIIILLLYLLYYINVITFFLVQLLSSVWIFATPWAAACWASLSFTIIWSLLKLMSIESVMPSNHLMLFCPLLVLPSVFPSIRVFSSELPFHIKWSNTGA